MSPEELAANAAARAAAIEAARAARHTLFESARYGSLAEKTAALDFAKVFRYEAEAEEFEAECLHWIQNRCQATFHPGGSVSVIQCDRISHDGNPWHVAIHRGVRYAWGPNNFQHQRPVLPDEEIP